MRQITFHDLLRIPQVAEVVPTMPDTPVPLSVGSNQVMYGETYDGLGLVFESLKYYAFSSLVAEALSNSGGFEAGADIIIADTAVTRNYPDQADQWLALGQAHRRSAEKIIETLNLRLRTVMMSEFIDSEAFRNRAEVVRSIVFEDPECLQLVEQTVPKHRRDDERAKGWQYAIEEIATILPYGVKVGPPRERFYDGPARIVANRKAWNELISVYLSPTYPLGVPMSSFIADKELASYGVTAYKAGSKGLKHCRVLLKPGATEVLEELVEITPVVKRSTVPSPLGEFADTIELVAVAAGGTLPNHWPSAQITSGAIGIDDARQRTLDRFRAVIATPLGL